MVARPGAAGGRWAAATRGSPNRRSTYPGGQRAHFVAIFELRDGKISEADRTSPTRFEPLDWPPQLVDAGPSPVGELTLRRRAVHGMVRMCTTSIPIRDLGCMDAVLAARYGQRDSGGLRRAGHSPGHRARAEPLVSPTRHSRIGRVHASRSSSACGCVLSVPRSAATPDRLARALRSVRRLRPKGTMDAHGPRPGGDQ